MKQSVTPGSGKFDNRAILAGFQAQDAARRRALMQRLSGEPAPPLPYGSQQGQTMMNENRSTLNNSRRNAAKRGESPAFSIAAQLIWARQMLLVMAGGGLTNAQGQRIYTPAQRFGLALAAYAEGWCSLHSDRARRVDTGPLLERLDGAAAEAISVFLGELTPGEVSGMAAFWTKFVAGETGERQ